MDVRCMENEYRRYQKINLVYFSYLDKNSHFTYEMGIFVFKQDR
jgi:hypothetical protein